MASLLVPILEHPAIEVVVSVISITEVLVRPARIPDRAAMEAIVASVVDLPRVRIVDFDQDHAIDAAEVRASARLKFPDAAIVATARRANAIALIGNDQAWIGRPLGVEYVYINDLVYPNQAARTEHI